MYFFFFSPMVVNVNSTAAANVVPSRPVFIRPSIISRPGLRPRPRPGVVGPHPGVVPVPVPVPRAPKIKQEPADHPDYSQFLIDNLP
jgi:hypothetical protein